MQSYIRPVPRRAFRHHGTRVALMNIREGSPHLRQGLEVRAPSQVYFPTVRPFYHHEIVTHSTLLGCVYGSSSLRDAMMPVRIERSTVRQECPDGTCHLVGQCHHHDIARSAL